MGAGILSLLFKFASVISILISLWQFVGFSASLTKFQDYQAVVAQVKASGDPQAVAEIPAVAAPDITQWISWLGPALLALASWGVSSIVKNPQLEALLQSLLKSVPLPAETSPAKQDGEGNQGPPPRAPGSVSPVPSSLFGHIEAIVAQMPKGSDIYLNLTTPEGLVINVSTPEPQETIPAKETKD